MTENISKPILKEWTFHSHSLGMSMKEIKVQLTSSQLHVHAKPFFLEYLKKASKRGAVAFELGYALGWWVGVLLAMATVVFSFLEDWKSPSSTLWIVNLKDITGMHQKTWADSLSKEMIGGFMDAGGYAAVIFSWGMSAHKVVVLGVVFGVVFAMVGTLLLMLFSRGKLVVAVPGVPDDWVVELDVPASEVNEARLRIEEEMQKYFLTNQ
mmetsp:Transcript_21772/g.30457  ORF Transcript_21772/g.30457 Transcript_21772/m.30457 type:complete len:210 (-) Transcript_21772:20-649(-)